MPPKTRTTTKRTVTRKATVPRSVRQKTYALKRSYKLGVLASAGSTAQYQYGSMSFTLNSLPGYTEFTNLFDQYRIKKVLVQAFPFMTQESDTTTTPARNIFHWCVDHTDVTSPAAESDVLQYDNHKTLQAFKPFNMSLTPVAATTVWQGVSSNGYAPAKPASWIDCKSYGVQHYGIKYVWNNNNSNIDYMDFYATFWVEFREPM